MHGESLIDVSAFLGALLLLIMAPKISKAMAARIRRPRMTIRRARTGNFSVPMT